jgi:hypothetical protein
VFVCFVALIHSCKRADQVIPAPDSKYSGKIYYTSFCYEYDSTSNFNYKQPIFYNASAQFFKEPINRQLEIVGDLMIGNYLVTFSNMYSEYCFTSTQRNDSLNLFQFGKKINFSISGGGDYSPVFTTVYVPKVIKIYSKNEPYQEHSKKDSMVIFWNPDPANATVEIDLMYDGTFSHSIDSTLDANPYYLDPIIVPDNGQYTLPASFFTQFKPGSWINFSVTRNGHGEMLSNNKWIEINATTSSEFQRSIVN